VTPPAKTAASRKRGAAARSEVNGKGQKIKLTHKLLADLALIGPPILPPTFGWDLAQAQSWLIAQDGRGMAGLFKVINSVLGDAQADKVRERIAEKAKDDEIDAMFFVQIVNDIANSYGTDSGES
jgi:hypothetical protein